MEIKKEDLYKLHTDDLITIQKQIEEEIRKRYWVKDCKVCWCDWNRSVMFWDICRMCDFNNNK